MEMGKARRGVVDETRGEWMTSKNAHVCNTSHTCLEPHTFACATL